jgi:hypothetical protein
VSRPGVQLRIRLTRAPGRTPKHVLRKPLRFPVALGDTFEVTEDAGWEDYETVGAGELSSPRLGPGARGLESFTGETMSCTWDPSWMTYPGQNPGDVREALQDVLRSRSPFYLLALVGPTGHRPEFSGLATMRTLTRTLRHGEPDARYYTIDFRRYREAEVGRRRHVEGGGGNPRLPTHHELKDDDTLESLARRYYGKPNLWKWIARANGIHSWGSRDPIVETHRYHAGDRLLIPKPPGNATDDDDTTQSVGDLTLG